MKTGLNHQALVITKTTVAAAVLAMVFFAGTFIGHTAMEPQAKANLDATLNPPVETRLVETRTVQIVETPAVATNNGEAAATVKAVKPATIGLRTFKDLEELKQWLAKQNTVTTVFFQYPGTTVDCDDFALALQQAALADGYLMNLQVVEPDQYNALFENTKIPADTVHAMNLVIIGNDVYFIEPQTGEVALAANVD